VGVGDIFGFAILSQLTSRELNPSAVHVLLESNRKKMFNDCWCTNVKILLVMHVSICRQKVEAQVLLCCLLQAVMSLLIYFSVFTAL